MNMQITKYIIFFTIFKIIFTNKKKYYLMKTEIKLLTKKFKKINENNNF